MTEVRYCCVPHGMSLLWALRSGERTFDTLDDAMAYLEARKQWSKAMISKMNFEIVAQYAVSENEWVEE